MPDAQTSSRKPRHGRTVELAGATVADIEAHQPLARGFEQALMPETPADRVLHSALAKLSGGFSPMGLAEAWFDWAVHLGASPGRLIEIAQSGLIEAAHITETLVETASGRGTCIPCARSLPHDKRFRHECWRQWPFAIHAESFLGMERLWEEARAACMARRSIISIF